MQVPFESPAHQRPSVMTDKPKLDIPDVEEENLHEDDDLLGDDDLEFQEVHEDHQLKEEFK